MKKAFKLFCLFCVSTLFLVGCQKGDDSSKYNISVNADENIEVKTYVDYEKDYLIVYLTNNNSYNIGSFDISATYYDDNSTKIGEDSTLQLDFMSGEKCVVTLDLPEDSEYNGYVPEKIDLAVKIDQEYQNTVGGGTLYNDKVSTSYKKISDEELEVTITNNTGKELFTVEVAVLFIKKGKPVYVDSLNKRLEIGESVSEMIDIPVDWDASENSDEDILIDYDSIEIVVNRASAD